jgi:hypothetical protein
VLFHAGDPADAAGAMGELIRDVARREALRLAARQRIADRFPLHRMEEGFDLLVRRLSKG